MIGYSLQIGHLSDVGRARALNEDAYLVMVPPATRQPVDALCLVADGVGGEKAGDVASGLLVSYFWRWFATDEYLQHVHYNPEHPQYFIAALKELLETANNHLNQASQQTSQLARMGTTATVLLLSGGQLFFCHVGDTRAYLLRHNRLSRLTHDHSWVAQEIAAGRLTEAQAQQHPRRNQVTQVLGSSPILRPQRDVINVALNDLLLVVSDGLHGVVSDTEIEMLAATQHHPQQICSQLVELANQRGGPDNITVVALRLAGPEQASDPLQQGISYHSVHLAKQLGAVSSSDPTLQPAAAAQPALLRPTRPHRRRAGRLLRLAAVVLITLGLGLGAFSGLLFLENTDPGTIPPALPNVASLGALLAAICTFCAAWIGFGLRALLYRPRPADDYSER